MNDCLRRLREVMNQLDTEDDDNVRADLIDEAIGLSDIDVTCAEEWGDYR